MLESANSGCYSEMHLLKEGPKLGVVVHICDSSTREVRHEDCCELELSSSHELNSRPSLNRIVKLKKTK